MNDQPPLTLYKIGGSLLQWTEFPAKLKALSQTDPHAILLAGGGAAADVVRDWDQRFQLGEERSHALALCSMTLTARLLHSLLPGSRLVANPEQLHETLEQQLLPILLVDDLVALLEPGAAIPLKHHWQTTSDTLALWLCLQLQIPALALVKSVPASMLEQITRNCGVSIPADSRSQILDSLRNAAAAGLIDEQFAEMYDAGCQLHPSEICPQLEWICWR